MYCRQGVGNMDDRALTFRRRKSSLTDEPSLRLLKGAMKMKIGFLSLILACAALSGCVSTIDGRNQPGMPFIRDKVEGRYERSPLDVWAAAIDVIKYNGI